MKHKQYFYILMGAFVLFQADVEAHDIPVHRQITAHATASAYAMPGNYKQFLDTFAPQNMTIHNRTPAGWIIQGSADEDNNFDPNDIGGRRSLNHFYDPLALSGRALSDVSISTDVLGMSPIQLGQDSFSWASTLDGPVWVIANPQIKAIIGNPGFENIWSWPNARYYELSAFTSTSKSDRDQNMSSMFEALGRVMHLLEDASQPQHVRNEQHADAPALLAIFYESPIEDYGKKYVASLNYQDGMLDWRTAGFTKLHDFWDRGFYNGTSAQPLIDSEDPAQPTKKLGLAEWCNGNFVGERHTYPELMGGSNPFRYPFPSLAGGTDWNALRANPSANKKITEIPNIGVAYRYIVAKTGQGRHITHHAAVRYLVASGPDDVGLPPGDYDSTVDDPDVLKDYHDNVIPEAIKYSAGLLDYYFRGNLGLSVDRDGDHYDVQVINTSVDPFKDGTFYIYQDDASGNRTLAATQPYSGTLNHLDEVIISLPAPVTVDTKFVVIYKGTIGVTAASDASDPVDAGIAIAAQSFTIVAPDPDCPDCEPCPDCSCHGCATMITPVFSPTRIAQAESTVLPKN